jgi:hypothetical protein
VSTRALAFAIDYMQAGQTKDILSAIFRDVYGTECNKHWTGGDPEVDSRPQRLGKRGRDDDDDGDDGDDDNHQDATPSETTARSSKKGFRNTFKHGYKRFKSSFKPKDDKKKQR